MDTSSGKSPPQRSTRPPVRRRVVSVVFALALLLVVFDFLSFADRAADRAGSPVIANSADAVVVLTGGGARIHEAARIAQSQKIPLFISGAHPHSSADEIGKAADIDGAFLDCCVEIGNMARTTRENGEEIAQWARPRTHERLIVVTSAYHLERAMLEVKHAMPEAQLVGHGVVSPVIDARQWWKNEQSARRIVAIIEGQAEGPTIGLRADFDALPITEATGAPNMPRRMRARCMPAGMTDIRRCCLGRRSIWRRRGTLPGAWR